jgi:hypothetical protein
MGKTLSDRELFLTNWRKKVIPPKQSLSNQKKKSPTFNKDVLIIFILF